MTQLQINTNANFYYEIFMLFMHIYTPTSRYQALQCFSNHRLLQIPVKYFAQHYDAMDYKKHIQIRPKQPKRHLADTHASGCSDETGN
jgi:hypothetical protein